MAIVGIDRGAGGDYVTWMPGTSVVQDYSGETAGNAPLVREKESS
jgi:hypothetical protein